MRSLSPLRLLIATLAPLLLVLPSLARADALIDDALARQSKSNDPPVIYLGTIAVGGEKEIFEALQSVKVALDQPLSNDPKLADVVVCRLSDDIGSHAKQLLICGTNRVLTQNKELLQSMMSASLGDANQSPSGDNHGGTPGGCGGSACYRETFNILTESLNNMRRHYLKQQVNGASLHQILASIPYPQQVLATPAAATVAAPAAITSHV